jgi:hypothetical protein
MRTARLIRFTSIAITLLVIASSVSQAAAQTDTPPLPRLFFADTIGQPRLGSLLEVIDRAHPIPLGTRIEIDQGSDTTAVDQYLDRSAATKVPAWIAMDAPATREAVTTWRDRLRGLFARHHQTIAILEVVFDEIDTDFQRFALEVAATEARARGTQVLVAASGVDAEAISQLASRLTANQSPYLDLLVLRASIADADRTSLATARRSIPGLKLVTRQPQGDSASIVRQTLSSIATDTLTTAWETGVKEFAAALAAFGPAAPLLVHPVEELDSVSVGLTLTVDSADVRSTLPHRVLFDEQTFATYLWYDGGLPGQRMEVGLRLASEGVPAVYDLTTRRPAQATEYKRDESASRTEVTVPVSGGSMVVDFSAGGGGLLTDRAAVTAARALSVQEVIARHRRQQARHDTLVRHYRAHVRMQQHFRPTLTDPGYDVVTENKYFVEGTAVEWEEESFSVNGSKWGADRPAFPLLQAEKVLSLPFDLRLSQDYRYELTGTERVGEVDCYRVRFEPLTDTAALYKGTVWIDQRSFAKVRVQAVQSRTAAPIVSNEETHIYEPVAEIRDVPVYLMVRQTARQIVLIAGRNLVLEKTSEFSDFQVNDPGFGDARESARRGERIMYADTDQGVRYFVKQGGTRVVSERATTRARAMALGVLVDPSLAFPLPIFGINYLNFQVAGRSDTQFALLFGGVLAAGNLQRPRIVGTPLDASVDFFGIAVPVSDRLYVADGERPEERLLTWPLSTGLNLGWQYTPFQKASVHYQIRFDPFVRDRTTAESFVVPSSTTTHGLGATWSYQRTGYSAVLNGTWYRRWSWAPWGPSDALQPGEPRYAKYAAHISKDIFVGAFQKVHVNVAYFGGTHLDRFSRYQFGLFDDTRIHGVPGSGIRFDDLGMLRGSYSFNIFEQYRLDLFIDQAWGRDRSVDSIWQPITGFGAAVNLRAPFNTILRADGGKSMLPPRYDELGSLVFQVMILKPLQ